MSTPNRSEAVLEAQEALRKLSGDLAIYRDPEVQRHLLTLTPGSKRRLESSSPAELHALVIQLRTELHQAAEERERTRKDVLQTRKRAARAEGQLDEMQQQLKQKEVEHEDTVRQASQRLDDLAKHHKAELTAAKEKAFMFQETMEKDRLGHTSLIAEKDRYHSQFKEAESNIAAMRRELEAMERKHSLKMKAAMRDKNMIEKKVDRLQKETKELRNASARTSDHSAEVADTRVLARKLQQENAQLKSELASQSKNSIALKSELSFAKENLSETRKRIHNSQTDIAELVSLREEKRSLRELRRKSVNAEENVLALAQEKEELARMIRDLSPTGNIQEGLQILTASKFDGSTMEKMTAVERNALNRKIKELESTVTRSQLELRHQSEQVAQLKKRFKLVEIELTQAKLQRDDFLSFGKRHERMRGIIEYEKRFFKQALEKIETEFDVPQGTDQYVERLKKRAEMYEKSCEKYKSEVKELEAALSMSRNKAEKVANDMMKTASEWRVDGTASEHNSKKRSPEVEIAVQKMYEALKAKEQAISTSQRLEKRIKELQAEIQRLQQVQNESELDYDPNVAKVVHVKANPLVQAVKLAQEEEQVKAGKKRMRMDIERLSPERDSALDSRLLALQKEVQELESKNEELAKKSKVGIRLGEVAKKKIEEVRAAVYNLFGWSMNVYGANYRIASIYAESPRDLLEFGMNEAGTMTLMETEYTSRLEEEIEQYVQKMNSVPALLANITMENFEKTTSFA